MNLQRVTTGISPINPLFDLESGMINPRFKHQLEIVGIVARPHFSDVDVHHIKNVLKELDTNGCFQKELDFYKDGKISTFKVSYEQAVEFLNDDYKDREIIMPREKKTADAIFPCGVEATMHKRFSSLKESLIQGYQYNTLHLIVPIKDRDNVLNLINTSYKEAIKNLNINIVIADAEVNIVEEGLQTLQTSKALAEEYVIITDPTFAPKIESIASSVLKNHHCLGIASAPIQDWKIEMNLYGYEEAVKQRLLGNNHPSDAEKIEIHQKAAIAWASAAWNFKARQVGTEFKAFTNKVNAL